MEWILGSEGRVAAERHLAEIVETDPERLGGVVVFRGTRVPVRSLFDHLRSGDSLEVFLNDFPGVNHEAARAVIEIASDLLLSTSESA